MDILITQAYDNLPAIRELFGEYTAMLVAGDPKFGEYLAIQKYDDEIEHPELKYALPGGRLYLAVYGDAVVGCIALRRIDSQVCEMKRLFVRPEYRGKGIGRQLAQRVIDDARQIGYGSMLLDTLPFLETAIGMYRRMGFYEIAQYNNSPLTDSIYLKLDLQLE